MTVDRSRAAADVASPEAAGVESVDDVDGADLGLTALERGRLDRIALSGRARALIRAGLAVRAFVLHGIDELHRRIGIGKGRTLTLDHGIYAVT